MSGAQLDKECEQAQHMCPEQETYKVGVGWRFQGM